MFDSTKIVTIIGTLALLLGTLAVSVQQEGDVIEHFGWTNTPMAAKAVPTMAASQCNAMKGGGVAVSRNLQSMLPPRIVGDMPLRSVVTYNQAGEQNQALRGCSPFVEKVQGCNAQTALGGSRCSVGACNGGSMGMSQLGSFPGCNAAKQAVKENFSVNAARLAANPTQGKMVMNRSDPSILPMNVSGCEANCAMDSCAPDAENPVVFNRFIAANRHSRLRAMGDKIRGDLAIAPCNSGWFQVSVTPSIDLEPGALAVMGGVCNQSGQEVASLVNMSSGGTMTAIAGVDMSNTINTCITGAVNDVTPLAMA